MPIINRKIARTDLSELSLQARIDLETQVTDTEVDHVNIDGLASRTYLYEGWRAYPVTRFMVDNLGPVAGNDILDLGCGYSMSPIRFANGGARVTACDVSPRAIAATQEVAQRQGVADSIQFHICPAEQLPFPDASFDLVHGASVLHHVDLEAASREIARVLKPGGKGVFTDPFGHNRLLELARDYLPYPGKPQFKGTDLPLTVPRIEGFVRNFSASRWYGLELFSMIGKPLRLRKTSIGKHIHNVLGRADIELLRRATWLQKYCRYVGIVVVR